MNFAGPFDATSLDNSPVSLGGDGFAFGAKPGFVHHHPSDAHVIVPDAHLLFSGTYVRIGNDLIISGSDQKFVVGNYFKGEARPMLSSKDGATLSGQIVDALTGHVVFAQAAGATAAAQVIGHVMKLAGSASVIRNGVSVELHIGDAVQKGDVVQTGSDSSVGMTFIDGSAFGMTANARMVLNEMIYDPNGSSNSSLISLVQGTITFVAGQTAKNGNMRVETPVATMGIRGTAVLVEISANDGPTKFSVLVEPGGHTGSFNLYDKTTGQLIGTVSQAGQVTFVSSLGVGQPPSAVEQLKTLADQQAEKFLIQQVFQLYFPNYTPDDSKPNSTKSNPRTDIGVPDNNIGKYAFDPVTGRLTYTLITPITNPDTHTTTDTKVIFYNVKAAFAVDALSAKEESPGDPATTAVLKLASAVHIDDPDIGNVPFFDVATPFVAYSGVLSHSSTTAPLTPAAKAGLHLDNLINIDQITGDVSFNRADFNFLAAGEKVEYIIRITASSGPDSANLFIKITITGENDAPTIETGSTLDFGGVTEDSVAPTANLETYGAIGFKDFDLTDAHTASFVLKSAVSSAHLPGFVDGDVGTVTGVTGIGSFSLDAVSEILTDTTNTGQVGWHFVVPDSDPVLQSLAVGQTIKQVYTVTITDGSGVSVAHDVEVTITGTNDVPTIAAADLDQADTIYEIPGQTGGTGYDHNASNNTPAGSIHFADVDLIDRPDATTTSQVVTYKSAGGTVDLTATLTSGQLAAIKGAFALTQSGNTNNGVVDWTYKLLDNVLDFLSQGETIQLVSTVRISDHNGGFAETTVTINIVGGANDVPNITSVTGLALTEAAVALHDTITVDFTDVDLTETGHTASVQSVAMTGEVPPGATVGQIFTSGAFLSLLTTAAVVKNAGDATGSATFNFDAGPGVFDYLAVGEVVTLSYKIAVTDSNSATDTHTVTVTVTGTNDAPVIDAIAATSLSEQVTTATLTLPAPIHVTFTDVDLGDVGHTASITAVTKAGVTTGLSLTSAQLIALVTPITATKADGSATGSVDLGFSAASTAFDYLAFGEIIKLTYTLTVNDGDGGVATKDFEITITGTNDAPVIGTATLVGAVTEDATLPAQTGSESATGTIAFSDVDLTDGHTVTAAFKSTDYSSQLGSLTAVKTSDTSGGIGGLITWTFIATDAALNALAAGQTVEETYTVTLDDGHGGVVTRDVVITITGANDAPTVTAALTLNTTEGNAPVVKDLLAGASDVDNGDTLSVTDISYTIDNVAAGTTAPAGIVFPNAHTINVDGASPAFDHLAAGVTQTILVSYNVRDAAGATVAQTETITVTGANDRPVLSAGLDLATITEDQTTNSGQLVGSFATGIFDADDGAVKGIAITGFTSQNGHWEYSINNGTTWTTFGVYSASAGLLLASDDKVRFVPDGEHGGSNTLTYVAWDQTSGTHGQTVSTPSGLHWDAFSQASQTAALTVTDINDAPVLDVTHQYSTETFTPAINPTSYASTLHDLAISDVDAGSDAITVTTTALHGSLSLAGPGTGLSVTGSGSSTLSFSGMLADLNAALSGPTNGVTYTSATTGLAETVTTTINDGHGGTDEFHFVFQQATATPGAVLAGTAGKDVVYSSFGSDTLTGNGGADSFVFRATFGHDTVTDYTPGTDAIYIDHGAFANMTDLVAAITSAPSAADTVITLDSHNSITLAGVTKAQVQTHSSDFHFV